MVVMKKVYPMINIRSRLKITRVQVLTEDICDFIKPKGRKKIDIIIVHAGAKGITNNPKSFKDYTKITNTIKSKLPNCKYAISNVIIRKEKPDIEKKVIEFNSRFSKFLQQK